MRDQLQLESTVNALSASTQSAWAVFNDYAQALMTSPSEPERYEELLSFRIRSLYVRVAFALEALELRSLLDELEKGFKPFRKNPTILASDWLGEPYPRALVYLDDFVSALRASVGKTGEATAGLVQLERILLGTPKLIRDRGITPRNESMVRNAMYELLLHPYPDTVRDVRLPKVSKTYKPDIGIPSLKAAIEYKFVDNDRDAKTAIGGVYEDVKGYAGSADWKHFFAVFYLTAAFVTPAQVDAEFKLSGVDHSWKPLLVTGGGRRRRGREKKAGPRRRP